MLPSDTSALATVANTHTHTTTHFHTLTHAKHVLPHEKFVFAIAATAHTYTHTHTNTHIQHTFCPARYQQLQ